MQMKITFLDASTLGDTPLDKIAAQGELVCYPTSTREEALERVADTEVLIINKIKVDKDLMDAAPSLKLICEAATGVNNIAVDEAARRGIPVRNVAAYSTDSVVQTTFMHILSLLGNAPYFDDTVKNGSKSDNALDSGSKSDNASDSGSETDEKNCGENRKNYIRIEIRDNGKGIDRETIDQINNGSIEAKDRQHIGMENVITRMRMYYGEASFVKAESVLGEGTVITLLIPYEGEKA